MLIDLKIKNFKSFYNSTTISMVADNKKREMKERLIKIAGNDKTEKNILPSMVIYGSNASGKTSIINAFQTLKDIITNGTIKKQINNKSINDLELDSFIHDAKKMKEPIEFNITFKTDLNIYNYILKIIAASIEKEERRIQEEELNIINYKVYGTSVQALKSNIFRRNEKEIQLNKYNIINMLKDNVSYLEDIEKILSQNMDEQDLFLTTGFKSNISLKIANDIVNWFQEYLITVIDFNDRKLLIKVSDKIKDNVIFMNNSLKSLTKIADFGPQKIVLVKNKDTGNYELTSLYEPKNTKTGLAIESRGIESRGTVKLLEFWLPFMKNFKKGGIFILDEFDSSIHPELIGGILDLFNNPEINTSHSQIIFNTHNPLYLQKRFFRRDQIMFVDKDEDTYISSVYKLSDFNVRNDNNYINKYFEGEFGALPYIDFASALESSKEEN